MNSTRTKPTRTADSLDDLLTIAEVCAVFARPNGRPLHPSTVYRWATKGLDGCRLQVVLIGRGMRTTRAWLRDFGKAVARRRGLASGQEFEA